MDRKKIMIVLIVFTIIFTFFGSALAYLRWVSSEEQKTLVAFEVSPGSFSCSADAGDKSINSQEKMLVPTDCTNTQYAIKRELQLKTTIQDAGKKVYMNIWMNILSLDSGLRDSANFKWVLSSSGDSCTTGVINQGTFNGLNNGSKIDLFNNLTFTTSTSNTYYLYIWLDKAETSTSTMNKNFEFVLAGECTDKKDVSITYNYNGANISNQTVIKAAGEAFTDLPSPTWDGYIFKGWYTAASGGTQVTNSSLVPDINTTYYAQWELDAFSENSFNYNGDYEFSKEENGDWELKFLSSGTMTFNSPTEIDIFAVGGGGGGGVNSTCIVGFYHYSQYGWNGGPKCYNGGGGGGGGYANTVKNQEVTGTYTVTIGAGGDAATGQNADAANGKPSSFGNLITANGGNAPTCSYNNDGLANVYYCYNGGSGGSGGAGGGYSNNYVVGDGGENGANGEDSSSSGGKGGTGDGKSKYAFGESSGVLYGSGGGGGAGMSYQGLGNSSAGKGGSGAGNGGYGAKYGANGNVKPTAGTDGIANRGGGGGGGAVYGLPGNGGSGIVIIRNARS